MTLRRVHVPRDRIEGGRARLDADGRHYLRGVLRLPAGAVLEVFDGEGGRWRAEYDGADGLALGPAEAAQPEGAAIWLGFGLAKAEKPEWVIQKATELGARRILPLATERAVVKLDAEKGAARAERWRKVAVEAARQCGRADVPAVDSPAALDAALGSAPAGFARVLFHPGGAPLGDALGSDAGYLLCVGPEGGFSPREVEEAVSAGARLASLGPRVLRAETAAITAVALVQALRGDLR
jgi:16S rRNA (uracil1498-N3)-methyltransferase